jgi:hypothetical protein
MKFVQNNKILEDSNAENAERSAEKTKERFLLLCAYLCVLCVSALNSHLPTTENPNEHPNPQW